MPIHRDLGNSFTPMLVREDDLDTICLQPLLSVIMYDKRPWLFDSHVHSLYDALKPQDYGRAGHVAANSLIAWLHRCVQCRVGWKDLTDTFLRKVVLVGDLDKTTLFCVCSAWISVVIQRVFKRVPCG